MDSERGRFPETVPRFPDRPDRPDRPDFPGFPDFVPGEPGFPLYPLVEREPLREGVLGADMVLRAEE